MLTFINNVQDYVLEESSIKRAEICDALMESPDDVAAVQSLEAAEFMTVLVYIHGWKHTADPEDTNVVAFEELVSGLAAKDEPADKHVVYGVYLGWPGTDYTEPLRTLRFWDRKRTADEVSRVDMNRDLLTLHKLWELERQVAEDKGEWSRLRFVLAGHSFGARIAFDIAYPQLLRGTIDASVADKNGANGRISMALGCKGRSQGDCRPLDNSMRCMPDALNESDSCSAPSGRLSELIFHERPEFKVRCIDETSPRCQSRIDSLISKIESHISAWTDYAHEFSTLDTSSLRLNVNVEPEVEIIDPDSASLNDDWLIVTKENGSTLYLPFGSKKTAKVVDGFGDLVILLNPAFEASRFLALHEAQVLHTYPEEQMPRLLVLASENDKATQVAFPFAKGIESGFGNGMRDELARTAIGNFKADTGVEHGFINSELRLPNPSTKCISDSVDISSLPQLHRIWVGPKRPIPFVVARTPKSIIDGHNGIFNTCVREFLDRFVRRVVILNDNGFDDGDEANINRAIQIGSQ